MRIDQHPSFAIPFPEIRGPSMKEEKIILYDSPEAARLLTPEDLIKTPVWFSRRVNGHQIITTDEHIAIYAGCTHITCTETGEVFEKCYSHGPTVRARREHERYEALRQVEVTDKTKFGILYDGSNVYEDEWELFDDLIQKEADDIGMVTVCNAGGF
jgi:hypothetical protein